MATVTYPTQPAKKVSFVGRFDPSLCCNLIYYYIATCMPCLPNFLLICAVSFARQGRPCQGKKIVVNDRMCSCAAGRSVIAITMYLCMRVRSMIVIASFVWSVSGARERGWRSMPAENLILVRHRVIYTCLDRLYEIIRSYG